METTPPRHTRRTVARGAAWAVPVVALGAAAPAVAASRPILQSTSQWGWYSNEAPYCPSGRDGVTVNSTAAGTYTRVINTNATTLITGVTVYFWFAKPNMTMTAGAGNSGCWTTPTADGTTATFEGRTYYRYASSYNCPIVASSPTTTLQPYSWRTPCYNEGDFSYMQTVRRQVTATINGAQQNTDTGFFVITNARLPGGASPATAQATV